MVSQLSVGLFRTKEEAFKCYWPWMCPSSLLSVASEFSEKGFRAAMLPSTVASRCHLCWGLLWYKSTIFFFFLLERLSWLSIPFLEGKQTKQKLKWWQKKSWVRGEGEFSPLLITLEGRDSKLAAEKRNTNLKKSQQSVWGWLLLTGCTFSK